MTIQYIITIRRPLFDESTRPGVETIKKKYSDYNTMGVEFATVERETAKEIIKDINSMDKLKPEVFYAILPDTVDEFSVYLDFFDSLTEKEETNLTITKLSKHGGIIREYFTFNVYATEKVVKIFNKYITKDIWVPLINKKKEKIYKMIEIPKSPEAFIIPRATEISEDDKPYDTYSFNTDSNYLVSEALEKYVSENHIAKISKIRAEGKEYKIKPRYIFSSKLTADLLSAKSLTGEFLFPLPTVDIVVSKNLFLT